MSLNLICKDPNPLRKGIYNVDLFQRNSFFKVSNKKDIGKYYVVRTWEEAYSFCQTPNIDDINPAYVASLITKNFDAEVSPYLRIKRLPRSCNFSLSSSGEIECLNYNPLTLSSTGTKLDNNQYQIRNLFLENLQKIISKNPNRIFCEHSSGLDSNAIIGSLIKGLKIKSDNIFSLSIIDESEKDLIENFRKFYNLKDENCFNLGTINSKGDFCLAKEDLNTSQKKLLKIFGAPTMIVSSTKEVEFLSSLNCSILFSGFGGDQGLSHNSANVPTDLFISKRFKELFQWSDNSFEALKLFFSRYLYLNIPELAEMKFKSRIKNFSKNEFLVKTLTIKGRDWLSPFINYYTPLELNVFISSYESISKQIKSNYVCKRFEEEIRLSKFYNIRKEFPLLDEKLISILLKKDPLMFGGKGKDDRKIFRDLFSEYLPKFLQNNGSKQREYKNKYGKENHLRQKIKVNINDQILRLNSFNSKLWEIWNIDKIKKESELILNAQNINISSLIGLDSSLITLEKLNIWYNELER